MGNLAHSRAIKRFSRGLVAGLGMTLVVSTVALPVAAEAASPSSTGSVERGLLDGVPILGDLLGGTLSDVLTPVAEGNGSISCVVPGAGSCEAMDLAELLSNDALQLVPVPGAGYQFESWTGCPTELPSGACEVPTSLLSQLTEPLAPLAEFVPIPATGDPTAPTVTITNGPERETEERVAVLAFSSTTEGATFECQLTGGVGQTAGFEPCESPTSYFDLEPSETAYTFAVRAVKDDELGEPATRSWLITEAAEADTRRPQTYLTEAPRNHSWLLHDFVSFRYASDENAADFQCGLDNRLRACPDRQKVYRTVSSKTHTFQVRAVDRAGNVDRSPARRTFTVPRNNTTLKHSRAWKERSGRGYYQHTYSQTSRKGATLSKRSGHIKRIALVATTGPRFGTVRVFVGKKVVKRKVSLHSRRQHKAELIPIRTFKHARRGNIRVVVTSRHRPVRIEGLGIATR